MRKKVVTLLEITHQSLQLCLDFIETRELRGPG